MPQYPARLPAATAPSSAVFVPRPNAPRWDVHLARAVLSTRTALADVDAQIAAPDGYSVGLEQADVLVWWTQDPKSVLFAVDAQGIRIGSGYRDRPLAVRALADHYGLPAPVRIVLEPEEGR